MYFIDLFVAIIKMKPHAMLRVSTKRLCTLPGLPWLIELHTSQELLRDQRDCSSLIPQLYPPVYIIMQDRKPVGSWEM